MRGLLDVWTFVRFSHHRMIGFGGMECELSEG